VAKDSDQSAGSFEAEKTGGGLAGLLAEENEYDRRALWRIGAWGLAAVAAVVVAAMTNQSSIGWRRDQLAAADLTRQAQQLQTVARESQNETRRLAAAIDTLNNDRDRLYSRVTVLETGLDSVTGAIARQNAAGPTASAPAPPVTPSKTSAAPPTAASAAAAAPDPEAAQANQTAAPAIAPVATAAPAATPPAATAAAPEKPRMDMAKLESKPEAKPEARLEAKSKPEPKPEAKPESKSEVRSKSEPKIEPRIEAKTEAKTEPKTEPKKTEAKSDRIEPKIEPKTEQEAPAPAWRAPQAAPLAGPLAPANASARPFAAITLIPPSVTTAAPSASMLGPPDPAAGKLIEPPKAANAGPSPAPVADAMASVTTKENDSSETVSAKLPVQRTEFAVELGGANSVNGLRALWRTVRSHADLAELRPIIVIRESKTGLGMQLRLAAGPLHDAAAAARICATLVEGGRSCETTVFDGQRLAMSADEVQPFGVKSATPAVKPGSYRRNAPRHAFTAEPPPPQPPPPPQKPDSSSSLSSMFGGSKH
jgi:hypothetical protein